jgi:hypothetical protein
MMNYSLPLILVCLLGFFSPSLAQEKSLAGKTAAAKQVKVKPSKVSSAKGREREKLFTDWMPQNDMVKLNDEKEKNGEQMIYFEYHEGKRQYRAIHSKSIRLKGWYWDIVYSEKEMEEEVNLYKTRGYEPAFVVLERNFYQILFVKPDQLSETQKLLKDLGVEPPTLK